MANYTAIYLVCACYGKLHKETTYLGDGKECYVYREIGRICLRFLGEIIVPIFNTYN